MFVIIRMLNLIVSILIFTNIFFYFSNGMVHMNAEPNNSLEFEKIAKGSNIVDYQYMSKCQ